MVGRGGGLIVKGKKILWLAKNPQQWSREAAKKPCFGGQLTQMCVGGVEWTQTFINHCFRGIFDPFLSKISGKFAVNVKVLGWVHKFWSIDPNETVFFAASLNSCGICSIPFPGSKKSFLLTPAAGSMCTLWKGGGKTHLNIISLSNMRPSLLRVSRRLLLCL